MIIPCGTLNSPFSSPWSPHEPIKRPSEVQQETGCFYRLKSQTRSCESTATSAHCPNSQNAGLWRSHSVSTSYRYLPSPTVVITSPPQRSESLMPNFAYQEPQCNKTVRLRHPLIGNRSRASALSLTLQRVADPGEEVLARLACREFVPAP